MRKLKHSLHCESRHSLIKKAFKMFYPKAMPKKKPPTSEQLAIGRRVKEAIQSLGRGGQRDVAARCNIEPQSITGWFNTGRISTENLLIVSEITHYSINWLITGMGQKMDPSRSTHKQTDEACESKAEAKYQPQEQENTEPGPDIRGTVPLISWVQAGRWCEAIDLYHVGDAEVWLPCPVLHGPHTYCLRVNGDSMTNSIPGQKSYPEGTLIFVDPDRPITNGCRVIAKLPGINEATFKEYREDGGLRYLKPLNQQYKMQEITEDMIVCGVVIFSGLPE